MYRGRLSGPLRDRLDLTVEVAAVPADVLAMDARGEASAVVRDRVVQARSVQQERMAMLRTGSAIANAALTTRDMEDVCGLDAASRQLLSTAVRRQGLTARGYERVRKVARTIADLAGAPMIDAEHVAEALQFRMLM